MTVSRCTAGVTCSLLSDTKCFKIKSSRHAAVDLSQRFSSPADLNQKLLPGERTGPPLYLGSSTSRQCSCCLEAEPAAPLTALSLPTTSRNLQPPRRAKCFGPLLTGWKEHYTMKAVALERNGKYESKKIECCSLSWMLVHLIAFATAHYCEAQQGE